MDVNAPLKALYTSMDKSRKTVDVVSKTQGHITIRFEGLFGKLNVK